MASLEVELHNLIASMTTAARKGDKAAVAKWATQILVIVAPQVDKPDTYVTTVTVNPLYFDPAYAGPTIYLTGGSPNNPNGLSFSYDDAIAWWKVVFGQGLNIKTVKPTFLPGSRVLSAEGRAAAISLGETSTNFAPADFNPLGLVVHP